MNATIIRQVADVRSVAMAGTVAYCVSLISPAVRDL